MYKKITYNKIEAGMGLENVIDIASPIIDTEVLSQTESLNHMAIMKELEKPNTTLFIPAMPTALGDGEVASNFRYKHDKEINNKLVERWMDVFRRNASMKNKVVITTVLRKERFLTLNMPEDGSIKIINNQLNTINDNLTQRFKNFLTVFNIEEEKVKVIRQASKGSEFNSYLGDMIGFMNMVNWINNPSIFQGIYMEAHVEREGEVYHRAEDNGLPIIKPVNVNGKEWKPKEGFDYMYFRGTSKLTPTFQKFYILQDKMMPKVYAQIFEAISLNENETKKMIRDFMVSHNYSRLSDFWVNDVDDVFTVMMIINCFDDDDIELTEIEITIKNQLELMLVGLY